MWLWISCCTINQRFKNSGAERFLHYLGGFFELFSNVKRVCRTCWGMSEKGCWILWLKYQWYYWKPRAYIWNGKIIKIYYRRVLSYNWTTTIWLAPQCIWRRISQSCEQLDKIFCKVWFIFLGISWLNLG